MANLILGTSAIREHDGLFSLNDLHRESGGEDRHKPKYWAANQQTQALIAEITKGGISPLVTKHGGRCGSQTYACRELVIAYAAWISPAFHLKVIRVFLDVAQPAKPKALPKPRPPMLRGQIQAIRISASVACGDLVMPVSIPLDSYDSGRFRPGDVIQLEYVPGANPLVDAPVKVRKALR